MACERNCVNGVHTFTGEELGYTRCFDLDTAEHAVYCTPSGVLMYQPRKQKLLFARVCNCERERRGWPLLPESKVGRAA